MLPDGRHHAACGCVRLYPPTLCLTLGAPRAALHFFDGGPLTAQYLLVIDTLNFCFWPESGLEYEHLARGLKVRALTIMFVSASSCARAWILTALTWHDTPCSVPVGICGRDCRGCHEP